jgi:hypothetical protein
MAQFFSWCNMTVSVFDFTITIGLTAIFGRKVSLSVFSNTLFSHSGSAAVRSRLDVSKNTSSLVGILEASQSGIGNGPTVTGNNAPMTNIDILNGSGHGINLTDHSFANLISVGGNGHAGYGVSGMRTSPLQVRSALTTITGALGDMSLGTDVVGFNAPVSYARLAGLPAGQVGINHSLGATIVSGASTAASPTVLTDGAAAYVANEFRGQVLRYTTGPAAGQQGIITDNAATTITVGAAFSPVPTPGGGDSYRIETYEPTGCRVEKVSP